MPLYYEIAFDLNTTHVTSLDFSKLGTKVATVTQDGVISVWDISTKTMYHPSSGPAAKFTPDNSIITWISENTFICALTDGSTLTGSIEWNSKAETPELNLRSKRLADCPIRMVSFDDSTNLLAVGDDDGVRLWKHDHNEWVYHRDLPSPHQNTNPEFGQLNVTAVAWIQEGILLVGYLHIGLVIWNTSTLAVERSFQCQKDRQICSGTLCHQAEKFVALNELNMVDIYDLFSGEIWSPPQLDNVFSVKSLHRGTGFLAGRYNQTDWVDISQTCVRHVLHQGTSRSDRVVATCVYQSESGDKFLVATASERRSIVWTAQESGLVGTQEKDSEDEVDTGSRSAATGWLPSWFPKGR